MGLDMYLYAEKYVSGYAHNRPAPEFDAVTDLIGIPASTDSPHALINVCVMYWRKANAIHSWFVNEVQDGVDECQRSYVSKDQLRMLIEACEADELTPVSGFFFGGTDKDEWYYEGLKHTVATLKEILANPASEDISFYYQSSW